jgi:HNH endonuclease
LIEGWNMSQQPFKDQPQSQFSSPQPQQPQTGFLPSQETSSFQAGNMPSLPNGQEPQLGTQAEQKSQCRRCGKELGFLDRLSLDKNTHRCRTCTNDIQQSLQRFRRKFLEVSRSGVLTNAEWSALQTLAMQEQLDKSEALTFIRKDALTHMERTLAQVEVNSELLSGVEPYISYLQATLDLPLELMHGIYQRLTAVKQRINIQHFHRAVSQIEASNEVTEEAEQYILHLQGTLAIPTDIAQPALRRLAYSKQIANIRKGILHTINTTVQLESDELCHLEMPATYHKVNAKSTTLVSGRLVATNKRLHFLSATRGTTINWSNIMRVNVRSFTSPNDGVFLELSKGTGNGLYAVSDPVLAGAVIDTLVKISKRQLVVTKTDPSRHIPQDVKSAVWQRDGGKCVQCGATSYLEFDHIIPHNKGGANTITNVQLLCRNCNLKKSDRI